jgi:hypothetical protein
MHTEGMGFDEVNALLKAKRPLTKLEAKHRRALEAWLTQYNEQEVWPPK